jgi:hypothetical protein
MPRYGNVFNDADDGPTIPVFDPAQFGQPDDPVDFIQYAALQIFDAGFVFAQFSVPGSRVGRFELMHLSSVIQRHEHSNHCHFSLLVLTRLS